jgi:uncharacterized Zn-binding protein involved in type VI secretion
MKRSYLKIGDKSSAGGTVTESIPLMSHHGTNLTFVGASVSCPACHSTGKIVAKGPRWPGDMMGKLPALEGDLCACKCYPLPVMQPSQSDMTMSFESHELAGLGFAPNGSSLTEPEPSDYWIRFALNESAGSCEGLKCAAHFADGSIEHGTFGADNVVHFDRPNSTPCQRVDILPADTREDGQSVTGNMLAAMLG